MAKLNDLTDYQEILDVFTEVIATTSLERTIKIIILGDEQQKKIHNVTKANPITRFLHKEDIYITVNQLVFEQLDTRQQILVAEEALAEITYDPEKDSITVKKQDYMVFTGIENKYGEDYIKKTRQLVREIYAQEKDK